MTKREKAIKEVSKHLKDVGNGFKSGFIPNDLLWVFTFNNTNRGVDDTKVAKIQKTFDVTTFNVNPISVTKDMFEVADGQNRLIAAMNAGVGAYVQVVPFTIEEIMIILNTTQKNWAVSDFFKSNASKGIESYQEGLELMAEYDIDLSTLMAFLPVGNTAVKNGDDFDMPEDIEKNLMYVSKIKDAEKSILGNYRRLSRWAGAMNIIYNRIEEIRDVEPDGYIMKEWVRRGGFDKIVQDLPKVIKKSTSGDQVMNLAGILSKAFDYRSKNVRLVFMN